MHLYGENVQNFKRLLLWSLWANFAQISYGASLGLGNAKIAKMVAGHWPRWPPCPYMVKTFKNLLLTTEDAFGLNLCISHRGREVYWHSTKNCSDWKSKMAVILLIFIIFPCHCAVYMYKIMILEKPLSQFPTNFALILLLKCDW